MMLKAFMVGQTDWPKSRYILVFAENGKEAKVLSQHHLDYDDWLKLFPNRAKDKDHLVDPNATEAYVYKT